MTRKIKDRKKIQRRVNKVIRYMNKNIENDNMWRGRFAAIQVEDRYCAFKDGSGGQMMTIFECYDKATGDYAFYVLDTFTGDTHHFNYHVWCMMNNFIVRVVDAWHGDVDPRTDTTNYKNIPIEIHNCRADNAWQHFYNEV